MYLTAGARGAMAGLMAEVVEDHVRTQLVDAEKHLLALNAEAAEQLLDVVRTAMIENSGGPNPFRRARLAFECR